MQTGATAAVSVLSDRRRVSLRVLAQTAEMVTSAVTFSARRSVTEIFRDGRVKTITRQNSCKDTESEQRHRNYKNRYKQSETPSARKETPTELKAQNRHDRIEIITGSDM